MINTVYFMAVLLIFIRMLTFFVIVPVFFPKGTPTVMKIFLAGIFGFVLAPGVSTAALPNMNSNYALVVAVLCEAITGLTLGYITNVCFDIIMMAGQLIDTNMGFSMMSMFDPNSNSNVTLLERLIYWMSLSLFFLVDGHHMLIQALVQSFKIIGPGRSIIGTNTVMLIVSDFSKLFTIGFQIAIPIVFIVLMTDITLGLIARTVPQLNVMILGLPVKILVGLACFSFALPMMASSIIHIFGLLPDIYKGIFKSAPAPLMIILASGEKTEDATPKKKRDAKKKGQVAKSKEVGLAATLLMSTLVLVTLGNYVGKNLLYAMNYYLSTNLMQNITNVSLANMVITAMVKSGIIILPAIVPITVAGVLASFAQTGAMLTGEPLLPKLSKINPLSGFKKMFSMRTVVDTIKDLAIVSIVGIIGYNYFKGKYPEILNMGYLDITAIPNSYKNLVFGIMFRITIVMVIIAILDYAYQRFTYNRDLRMTKQEIKEEFRQEEGDPQIKSKIKQKQREISAKRMMASVPQATVVVTNPTHIAVALKYQEGDEAPTVVAKGSGYVAIRIKEIAKENNVPIIENKPLARLIFSEVEILDSIPVSMYQAVAEILAVIYKMKKKRRGY